MILKAKTKQKKKLKQPLYNPVSAIPNLGQYLGSKPQGSNLCGGDGFLITTDRTTGTPL